MGENIWLKRWQELKAAGVTHEQAKIVWRIVNEARGFGYNWLAEVSWDKLEETYGEGS